MGKPTGATVVFGDEGEASVMDVDAALSQAGGRVELLYDYAPALVPPPAESITGLWRYSDLLPLAEGPVLYPLQVGGTPLVPPLSLRRALGLDELFLKDETRAPTCSNKDRATALVLEHALRESRETVSCASTGNVAVSLAVGAAATGKRAVIFVPAEVAGSKLELMLLAGATVVKVVEGYEAAFRLSEEAAARFGWYSRNTGVNPLTLEAKKTVAFEIWEQLGRTVPDIVVSPVGDGVTLAALAKGFRELLACRVAERLPRLIGVQAAGSAPLVESWETGQPWRSVVPRTIADGIAVGAPCCGAEVLRDVRASGGTMLAVTDDELLEAIALLGQRAGLLAEPAGAAAMAGLLAARRRGLIEDGARVVALVTGSLLKNLSFVSRVPAAGRAVEVRARLEDVEHAVVAGTG